MQDFFLPGILGTTSKAIIEDMRAIFEKICSDFEATVAEMDGEDDHVHLLVDSVAKLVNSLKGVSSRKLRQMHPQLEQRYYRGVLWSPSYFAAPISVNQLL